MSHSRETDNEEPLFQFDSYEGLVGAAPPEERSASRSTSSRFNPSISHFSLSTPNLLTYLPDQATLQEMAEQLGNEADKGKGPSQPVLIRTHTTQSPHDTFDVGSSSSAYFSMESMAYSSSSPLASSSFDLHAIPTPLDDIYQRLMIPGYDDPVIPGSYETASNAVSGSVSGKGKARELAPMLPPLQFTPTELGYDKAAWPSPAAGPSSYGSSSGSATESTLNANMAARAAGPSQSPPMIRRMPSRRRSFSNLSTRSMRALAPLRATSKTTGNLARRILQRSKAGTSPSTPGTATPRGNLTEDALSVGQGSCLMPWRSIQSKDEPPLPYLDWDAQLRDKLPVYNGKDFKGKGRSYSSPYPLSALDIIPVALTSVLKPIIIPPRKFFDESLPRELRLSVLSSLVALHEEEHARMVLTTDWSVTRASSNKCKYVGKEKGLRELVKFSRVSRYSHR